MMRIFSQQQVSPVGPADAHQMVEADSEPLRDVGAGAAGAAGAILVVESCRR